MKRTGFRTRAPRREQREASQWEVVQVDPDTGEIMGGGL